MKDNKTSNDHSIDISNPSDKAPLFKILRESFERGRNGVLTVVSTDGVRTPLTLVNGRIISVIHKKTSAASVLDLLQRSGLLSERDIARAEREARRRSIFIEDAILKNGMVSEGTLSATREKLCLEVLTGLLLSSDVEVTTLWSVRRGTRNMCSLPVPFLLKEARKRAMHMPDILRVIPSNDISFAKISNSSEGWQGDRWEDLQLSVAEKQVYFFVDGKRSVSDLALSTCQSEFNVLQALKSLVEIDLVKMSTEGFGASSTSVAFRSAFLRLFTLLTTLALLIGAATLAIHVRSHDIDASLNPMRSHGFTGLKYSSAQSRLEGAVRLYEMTFGKPPESFDDLVREHYVLREDRRAAITFPFGDGFLLKGGRNERDEAERDE